MTLPADLPAEQARVIALTNEIQASADQEEWYFHNGVCEEEYHADLRKYAEVLGELERVRTLLLRAAPMLRAGVTYHQKRAHAAHALPGSRDRAGYDNEANNALFRLRLDSAQKGADAVLAALAPAPEVADEY